MVCTEKMMSLWNNWAQNLYTLECAKHIMSKNIYFIENISRCRYIHCYLTHVLILFISCVCECECKKHTGTIHTMWLLWAIYVCIYIYHSLTHSLALSFFFSNSTWNAMNKSVNSVERTNVREEKKTIPLFMQFLRWYSCRFVGFFSLHSLSRSLNVFILQEDTNINFVRINSQIICGIVKPVGRNIITTKHINVERNYDLEFGLTHSILRCVCVCASVSTVHTYLNEVE